MVGHLPTTRALQGLREAEQRYQRPAALGRLEISITPRGPVNRERAEQFTALVVHRLILAPPRHASASELEVFVESVGTTLIGQV